jgi:hypothetical protein
VKEFWLREIAKHTNLEGDALTLRVETGRYELDLLEIGFRDGKRCYLCAPEQDESHYDVIRSHYDGERGVCTEVILSGDLLTWKEEIVKDFSPRDRTSGKYDVDADFSAMWLRECFRHVEDIVFIERCGFFNMNFLEFEPSDSD